MTTFGTNGGQFALVGELVSVPDRWLGLLDTDAPVPKPVENWLAALALLKGVPFNAIVPDDRALPPESIRFFYVDPNWVAAACDGAFSIGRVTTFDQTHDAALAGLLHARMRARRPAVRPGLLERDFAESTTATLNTGFLLRSEVAEAWPTLEVTGYSDDAGTNKLPILRLEHLSQSVLFGLFDGVLARVDIAEPSEGIQFGAEPVDEHATVTTFQRELRQPSGPNIGNLIPGKQVQVPMRGDAANRVVDVVGLATDLQTGLGQTPAFTSGEFAVQMVEAPETARFHITATTGQVESVDDPAIEATDARARGGDLLERWVQEVLDRG